MGCFEAVRATAKGSWKWLSLDPRREHLDKMWYGHTNENSAKDASGV